MEQTIIKNSLTEYGLFLLNLALKADPERFFPFPKYFRTKNPNTNSEEKLDYRFAPYSPEDYKRVLLTLQLIDKHKANLSVLYGNKDCAELMKYLFDTEINLSHIGCTFSKNIDEYEFKYSLIEEQKRNIKYKQRWYLFHGSREGNWHSIVRNGVIQTSGTKLMSTGAMLGAGIYATSEIATAFNYGNYVAVIEVTEDIKQFEKAPTIYVITKPECVIMRYLLIAKNVNNMPKDLLEFYKRSREKLVEVTKKDKFKMRIEEELKKLPDTVKYVSYDEVNSILVVSYKELCLNINLERYPFEPPSINIQDMIIDYKAAKLWIPKDTINVAINSAIEQIKVLLE